VIGEQAAAFLQKTERGAQMGQSKIPEETAK
jgi:hypothetical protein